MRGIVRHQLAVLSAALLSSASFVAMAQDAADTDTPAGSEEVTVTAQRTAAQSIQRVPMAVTALGAVELKAREIESFKDLQFSVPSVTYSNANFSGANFQIRGIGITSVAGSADSGVSVHSNDVYLYGTAGLPGTEFYDLERIEVLRGPQSTLYGRNATGGVVNMITKKPDTDETYYHLDATYGEYNTVKGNIVANAVLVPDQLAVRVALNYGRRDGYVDNLYTGNEAQGQNIKQGRASLRWTPDDRTTIDFVAAYTFEKDTTMRSQKQLCQRDPTGVIGCLPDTYLTQAVNSNSTAAHLLINELTLQRLTGRSGLGLINVLTPGPGGNATSIVPSSYDEIYTDIDPTFRSENTFYMASIEHQLTDWLTVTLLLNHSKGENENYNSYNNLLGDNVAARLQTVVNNITAAYGAVGTQYVNTFFRRPDGSLALPMSIAGTGGTLQGPSIGNTVTYGTNLTSSTRYFSSGEQDTAELRFTSSFDGPFNFLLAGFYIDATTTGQFRISNNAWDYYGIIRGLHAYAANPTGPLLVYGPTDYLNETPQNSLKSKAIFGEAYWDIIPEELKLTVGLRWLEDEKRSVARTTRLNYFAPLGTTEADRDNFLARNNVDFDRSLPGNQLYVDQTGVFQQTTGRAVIEWTPDLDFTDQTMFYASYSRGYKSGGFNPPVAPTLAAVIPASFKPETVNAYEIGMKNRLADNAITLNVSAYYYDYKDYQIATVVERTAVNNNYDAKIWGIEGEFAWRIDDNWRFNMTLTHSRSEMGDVSAFDQHNPTAGVPNAIHVKDLATGASCVLLMSAAANGLTPAERGVAGFFVPPAGVNALAGNNIPKINFGTCSMASYDPANAAYNAALGYSYVPDLSGVRVNLEGNELPQKPNTTLSLGIQYTAPLSEAFELVARADYYWQDEMYMRIFNTSADRIESWDVLNVSLQLNALEQGWYAKLFATNVLDERQLTGGYLTDATTGLFTNAFVQDPRVIGVQFGVDF